MIIINNIAQINKPSTNIYIDEDIIVNKPIKALAKFSTYTFDKDTYVSYGWIDAHAHIDPTNLLYPGDLDVIGYQAGVCLVIDAGSCGKNNLTQLINANRNKVTQFRALLNISNDGISCQNELSDLTKIDFLNLSSEQAKYVVGYKLRLSHSVVQNNNIIPLQMFTKARLTSGGDLPAMIHIGNQPPSVCDIIPYLQTGDIITHCLHNKNTQLFDKQGVMQANVQAQLINKRLFFDIGYGIESFAHHQAELVMRSGFKVDMISSDLYQPTNHTKLIKTLGEVMSIMHYYQYSWAEVIDKVTQAPAKIFRLNNMGVIKPGMQANLTFFKIIETNQVVLDANQTQIVLTKIIKPTHCMIKGKMYVLT